MHKRSSRTLPGRYWLWAALAAAMGFIVLLIIATIWFGLTGAVLVLILVFVLCMQILKAWESGKLPFFSQRSPARRDIPYYQPSRQPSSPSYEQGYQQQQPSHQNAARSHKSRAPKDVNPSEYEQPQALYPEQTPPVM